MLGLLLILLAQVSYSIGGVIMRKYLSDYNGIFVNSILVLMNIIIFVPVVLIFFRAEMAQLNIKTIWPFVIAALLWIGIAETLYVVGLQKSPSLTSASLMTLFYPLFSTILGIWILKEPLTYKTIIGAVLMVSGFVALIV